MMSFQLEVILVKLKNSSEVFNFMVILLNTILVPEEKAKSGKWTWISKLVIIGLAFLVVILAGILLAPIIQSLFTAEQSGILNLSIKIRYTKRP